MMHCDTSEPCVKREPTGRVLIVIDRKKRDKERERERLIRYPKCGPDSLISSLNFVHYFVRTIRAKSITCSPFFSQQLIS